MYVLLVRYENNTNFYLNIELVNRITKKNQKKIHLIGNVLLTHSHKWDNDLSTGLELPISLYSIILETWKFKKYEIQLF